MTTEYALQTGRWTREKAEHNHRELERLVNGRVPDEHSDLALGYQKSAGELVTLPSGDYPMLPFVFRRSSILRGCGPANTRLTFEYGYDAIDMRYNAAPFGPGAYDSAQGAALEDLTVCISPEFQVAAETGPGRGIVADARVRISNVHVAGFRGTGVDIEANAPSGEASCTQLRDVRVHACGYWGVSILGGDANVCKLDNVSVTGSRGGVRFEPQMGGVGLGCHVNNGSYYPAEDRLPAYQCLNDGSPVVLIGCYAEGDTPKPIGCADALFVNCHFGSGTHPDSQAQEISGGSVKHLALATPFGWLGIGGTRSIFSSPGLHGTYGLGRFGSWAKGPGTDAWVDIGSTDGAEFATALALPGAQIPGYGRIPSRSVKPGALWVDTLYVGDPYGGGYGRVLTCRRDCPRTGAWQTGDYVRNARPPEYGPLVLGWICVKGGDFALSPPIFREHIGA